MDSIIVALLGCLGTIIGSGLGVIASSKLTNFRIQELEKKVEKHNEVVQRTFVLEEHVREIAEDIKELKEYHR
jgi:hypothetical protein